MVANSSATAFKDAKRSDGVLAIILRQTASIRGSRSGRNWLGGVGFLGEDLSHHGDRPTRGTATGR